MKGGQKAQDRVISGEAQGSGGGAHVGDQITVRQRHRLGRLLRSAGEQHHRRAAPDPDRGAAAAPDRAANERRANVVNSHLPTLLRRSSRNTHSTPGRSARSIRSRKTSEVTTRCNPTVRAAYSRLVCPVVQLSTTGSLPARCRASRTTSEATDARQEQANVVAGQITQTPGDRVRRSHQQLFVGQDTGQIVGHYDVAPAAQGPRDQRLGHRLAEDDLHGCGISRAA